MTAVVRTIRALAFLGCAIGTGSVFLVSAAEHSVPSPDHSHLDSRNADYESEIVRISALMRRGDISRALESVETHLRRFPHSRPGHYLRATALQALAGELDDLGKTELIPPETLRGLTHQLQVRWRHAQQHPSLNAKLPASLLHIGSHQFVIVADLAEARLYLFQNDKGRPKLVRDYYMSVGSAGYGKQVEGDNKTPIGVYEINRHIEGKALPDLYGKGAFPVNYPNRYDRYLGRTGYGIWLHGTPSDTYARAPWSSEGCFVLSNDDLLDIEQYINVEARTPVILSDKIEWIDADELAERQGRLMSAIQSWEQAWEGLDTDAVIAHYRKQDFNWGQGDFTEWSERKRGTNKSKKFVQIDLDVDGLFAYPGVEDMAVFRFTQHYYSNNYTSESRKEQYWQRNHAGDWQIVFEGIVR